MGIDSRGAAFIANVYGETDGLRVSAYQRSNINWTITSEMITTPFNPCPPAFTHII